MDEMERKRRALLGLTESVGDVTGRNLPVSNDIQMTGEPSEEQLGKQVMEQEKILAAVRPQQDRKPSGFSNPSGAAYLQLKSQPNLTPEQQKFISDYEQWLVTFEGSK